jgi:hypothetical protein
MDGDIRKVSTARFVMVAELLDQAFPKAPATPDHLAHHCDEAEQALLSSIGSLAFTSDKTLARLLAVNHRD